MLKNCGKLFLVNEMKIVGGEHGFPKKPATDAALYLAEKYKKDGF